MGSTAQTWSGDGFRCRRKKLQEGDCLPVGSPASITFLGRKGNHKDQASQLGHDNLVDRTLVARRQVLIRTLTELTALGKK